MTEPNVSFAGNPTDDPELRHTENGIARPYRMCRLSPASRLR